ncbi:MAG TPA: DUF6261 family protein [Prolixibacteraceae bacterium]|nr:DUF6261 family protein [Prolixibacteraceae bacterium]
MEKIIIPSLLSVSDGILMADRILETSQPLTVNDPKLLKRHTTLSSVKTRLLKNQKNSNKSLLTGDLILLDKRRNSALNALKNILYGMSVSLIEDVSKKAAKPFAIIEKYGGKTYNMGYKEETSNLLSLFLDFDLPANNALLADLGILPFYESLKAAQIAFDTVSKQKSDQKAEQANDSEPATDILTELTPAMTNVMAMIELNNQDDPETYGDVYNKLVTYINEINTAARARKTRKQNGNDQDIKPDTK